MEFDTIEEIKIKGNLVDVPLDEYAKAKEADGYKIESSVDADGRQLIHKDNVGSALVEKKVKISEDDAATAAGERGVSFPEGSIERVVTIFGSDSRVDRHGDIVMQDWNLSEFGDNPVTLFGHDWVAPPIGASLREKVVNRKIKLNHLRASIEKKLRALKMDLFFPAEDVTKFGDEIFRLINAGILRTFSVGFMPGKVTRVEDDKERERLGLGKFGFILSNNLLMEISATPIPANVGAHVLSCSAESGIIDGSEIQTLREMYRNHYTKANDESGFVRNDSGILEMWHKMFPTVTVSKTRDFGSAFDPDAYEIKPRSAPKTAPVIDKDGKPVGSDPKHVDNDNPESKDQTIEEIISKALEPISGELRTLKDTLKGMESQLDDISLNQIQEPLDNPEDEKSFLGSALATILIEKNQE